MSKVPSLRTDLVFGKKQIRFAPLFSLDHYVDLVPDSADASFRNLPADLLNLEQRFFT